MNKVMIKEEILAKINPLTEHCPMRCDVGLGNLVENINNWKEEAGVTFDPDFQRGHVWTLAQQQAFIESLLKTSNTNTKILVNRHGLFNTDYNPNFKYSGKYVVIDGLQRLTAMLDFCNGKFKVFNGEIGFEDLKQAKMLGGMKYNIEFYFFEMESEEEILDYYINLNNGGTTHSKEEIERVKQLKSQIGKA